MAARTLRSSPHCINGHERTQKTFYIDKRGRGICRLCRQAAVRRWEQKYPEKKRQFSQHWHLGRRAKSISLIRGAKNKPCMDCGVKYPFYVMDLDHRDPATKLGRVSQMIEVSDEALIAEISKCDAVCANCHRERTWGKKK